MQKHNQNPSSDRRPDGHNRPVLEKGTTPSRDLQSYARRAIEHYALERQLMQPVTFTPDADILEVWHNKPLNVTEARFRLPTCMLAAYMCPALREDFLHMLDSVARFCVPRSGRLRAVARFQSMDPAFIEACMSLKRIAPILFLYKPDVVLGTLEDIATDMASRWDDVFFDIDKTYPAHHFSIAIARIYGICCQLRPSHFATAMQLFPTLTMLSHDWIADRFRGSECITRAAMGIDDLLRASFNERLQKRFKI